MFDVIELSVCTVCLHLIANGEFEDGTDVAEQTNAAMVERWGEDVAHMVLGGDELGFCDSACTGCGAIEAGDRFTAAILRPIPQG